MRSCTIGDASPSDVDGLIDLENASFGSDRISARSFRRLVRSPSAAVRVVRAGAGLAGCAVILFRRGSAVARLYSVAIAVHARGRGLARALMRDAERLARRRGARRLRLEVREDNGPAIGLYERLGFRRTGIRTDYYADGATALRFEKRLRRPVAPAVPSAGRAAEPPEGS